MRVAYNVLASSTDAGVTVAAIALVSDIARNTCSRNTAESAVRTRREDPQRRQTLTYGTTLMNDASTGDVFQLTVSNSTGFSINAPTNGQDGQIIAYDVLNSSGRARGAITWTSPVVLAGGTFTTPAFTKSRTTSVCYVAPSGKWRERARASAEL